ncbi:MAG TPA: HD domain-containing protein [Pseudobacteroides sp.]|nr:HD domain-containing protein [Pseudobacteroides sp.]
MDKYLYESLSNFFINYVKSFYIEDEETNFNLKLKEEHTMRVCTNITEIGKEIGLDESELILAKTIALFHDIGRFEQFSRYRTFSDARSENHSELGIKLLIEKDVLNELTDYDRNVVIMAIRNHNALKLPDMEDAKALTYAKLIRDADKLDILGILFEYYKSPKHYEHLKVGESSGIRGISSNIIESVLNLKHIKFSDVKTSDDMKLLRLSWIYDINYKITLMKVLERGYLDAIFEALPNTDEVTKVRERLLKYISSFVGRKNI